MNPQTLAYARPEHQLAGKHADRPWMPGQLVAASFLFGPLAGGVVAGINFARLGRGSMKIPSIAAGLAVFAAQAVLICFVLPEDAIRPIGMIGNIGFGLLLMSVQKPVFNAWQSRHWQSTDKKDRYRPNRIGLLFLTGVACLAAQTGILLALLAATGQL